jgi:hypothetical protein
MLPGLSSLFYRDIYFFDIIYCISETSSTRAGIECADAEVPGDGEGGVRG